MEALHNCSIFGRDPVAEGFGSPGSRDVGGIEQVFNAEGNPVQRSAIVSGSDFFIGFFRLCQGKISRQGDDAAQLWIEALNAVEVDLRKASRG